jgi:hypothetical protein
MATTNATMTSVTNKCRRRGLAVGIAINNESGYAVTVEAAVGVRAGGRGADDATVPDTIPSER